MTFTSQSSRPHLLVCYELHVNNSHCHPSQPLKYSDNLLSPPIAYQWLPFLLLGLHLFSNWYLLLLHWCCKLMWAHHLWQVLIVNLALFKQWLFLCWERDNNQFSQKQLHWQYLSNVIIMDKKESKSNPLNGNCRVNGAN